MQIGSHDIRLEKRVDLNPWQAALTSSLAVVFALALFGAILLVDRVDPARGYREMFAYGFANSRGLILTVSRSIFLLLCTLAFILPYRAGLWNIGMAGQLYMGALAAFGVVLAVGGRAPRSADLAPESVLPLMMLAAAAAGGIYGGIAGLLRGKWDVNEIVVTMMLNFIAFWLVSAMIKEGGPLMNPGGRGESFELPTSLRAPLVMGVPFTVFIALGLAALVQFVVSRTRIGFEIRAFGRSPVAARYAGIDPLKVALLVFVAAGAVAGLAGYHLFAAVPGVYKIARNYNVFGDLAFYGIICGLISLGNPLAAIPLALLFGGLSVGGRFAQGKLHLRFGVDYAMLGILTIALAAFQFFYQYRIVWARREKVIARREKIIDVGVPR